jgi:CIC family chloride channel protein
MARRRLDGAIRLAAATGLTGLGAGFGGVAATAVLHLLEHAAFGYTHGPLLDALLAAPPGRRVTALATAGLVGAVGWWALRRFGPDIVTIPAAIHGKRMRAGPTLANVGLQIGVVGLGASIGREAAPRELGALLADRVTQMLGLSGRERAVLIACGAGAGLAAVYNVPLSGALFTIEVLLSEIAAATVIPALGTAAIAALIARSVLSTGPLYVLPALKLTPAAMVWAVPIGFISGAGGVGFLRTTRIAQKLRPRGRRVLWVMPIVVTLVGTVAVAVPEMLGNGRAAAQTAFDGSASLILLLPMTLAKAAATASTIGAGAVGGILTPSVAIGAGIAGPSRERYLVWCGPERLWPPTHCSAQPGSLRPP